MIYLLGLLLLFMYPACVAMSITQWSKDPIKVKRMVKTKTGQRRSVLRNVQPKLSITEVLLCCIPYGSVCMLWKALYGKCKVLTILSGTCAALITFRVCVVFLTMNETLFLVSFILFWIAILVTHVMYMVTYFAATRLLGMSLFITILSTLLPYCMAFFLRAKIPKIMHSTLQEEAEV